MAGEWVEKLLGELAENFDSKRVPLSSRERENRRGPYPYYGATGIMDYVDDFLFEGLYLLVAEDGSVERPDGKPFVQLVDGQFWVNNHAHVLKGATDEETLFLYYALQTVPVRPFMSGSVQAKLSQANLNRIPVPYPLDHAESRTIAHILGTLDDKIELNRRMSETMEQMARALFKAWFVDFEPVRAKCRGDLESRPRWRRGESLPGLPAHLYDLFPDRLVDSELGEIPEGWEEGCMDDVFDLTMGQSPPGTTYNEDGEGIAFYQGRADFTFRFPKRRVFCTAPTRFAKAGDTLISVRAPVGDINMALEDCAIGRGIAAARHKSGAQSYTYYFMLGLADVFSRFEAGGTVFGSISKKDFHAIQCVVVPHNVIDAFERFCMPIDGSIEHAERESRTLTALRDALLPRLISGELQVKDAERFLKERWL